MRRLRTTRPTRVIASRWVAWATQLAARHVRFGEMSGIPLRWRSPMPARTLILLQQRQLFSYLKVQPKLNLCITRGNIWNIRNDSMYSPQTTLWKMFASANDRRLAPDVARAPQVNKTLQLTFPKRSGVLRALARESVTQPPMTLAIARARTERLSTSLQRRFLVRRENDLTEVSRLLTQRTQRVYEVSDGLDVRPPMSLRKEASLPAMTRPAAFETDELGSFDRQSRVETVPAMPMPSLDVENLASQVMKQIDRRITARRERMGQT